MSESKRHRPLLGTVVEIRVCGRHNGIDTAINSAFSLIALIDSLMSFQNADSELSRLNRWPQQWHRLHSHTLRVLRLARALGRASDERFNCTVGGKLVRSGALPNHGGPFIDVGTHADIELQHGKARLTSPVKLTLDGIAKGYAVDLAVAELKRFGLLQGSVNAGGDLRVFGHLRTPLYQRDPDGHRRYLGQHRNLAIATSSFGHQYPDRHPSQLVGATREQSFSVLARSAWRADGLTKVAAVANESERETLITRLGGQLIETPHPVRA